MGLKDLVRALTPPILWRATRPFNSNYRVYDSWQAAAAAAGSYADAPLNQFRVARAAANPGGWAANEGQAFVRDHASPAIDFASIHVW